MSMMNCPECGKEVSDKAFNCPHCGYPIKTTETPMYALRIGQPSPGSNDFSSFLRIIAVICWIGGLIVSIIGANVLNIRTLQTEFSFATFITILIPYAIYGGLFYGLASVVDSIRRINDMVEGMRLETISGKEKQQSNQSNGRMVLSQISSKKIFSSTLDENDDGKWICNKCGAINSANRQKCTNCNARFYSPDLTIT